MQAIEDQKAYLLAQMKDSQRKIQKYEGDYKNTTYSDDEDLDFIIPVTSEATGGKNAPLTTEKELRHLQQNMGDNIFSSNYDYIYSQVWGINQKTSAYEINLFEKKLQYVQNIINESSRDIIICSTLCVVILITQYILSNVVFTDGSLMIEALAFGGQGNLENIEHMLRLDLNFGIPRQQPHQATIIWEGLHDFILFLVKCYQMRLFDVIDYETDLCKE